MPPFKFKFKFKSEFLFSIEKNYENFFVLFNEIKQKKFNNIMSEFCFFFKHFLI